MNMSTTLKILIAIVAGTLLICLAAGLIGIFLFRSTGLVIANQVQAQPEKAVRVGSEIAEYDVPEGFPDVFSAQLAGYKMVGYTGSDSHSHIYFFQLPADVTVDLSDMEKELKQTFPSSTDSYRDIRVVDTQPGRIAGQDVTLVISEGINHEGETFREVSAAFQGNGGQAMVVFSRPIASWNQAEVDTFLASIR
jgi:hypothetical protein